VSLARTLGPFDIQIGNYRETIPEGVWPTISSLATLRKNKAAIVMARQLAKTSLGSAVNAAVKRAAEPELGLVPQHAAASVIRDAYPKDWTRSSSFCVVRNPYDRVVSDYFWRTRNKKRKPSFADYVEELCVKKSDPSDLGLSSDPFDTWPLYTENDTIIVDRVIRFENLQDELASLAAQLGFDWDGWLPAMKNRKGRPSYGEMYGRAERIAVSSYFEREIEEFNYDFE